MTRATTPQPGATPPSLSRLFRQMTAAPTLSARALIDSETAARAAAGRVIPHERDEVAAALAGSASHADLVRMLRALQPASDDLAHALAAQAPVQVPTHAPHPRQARVARVANGRRNPDRGWQWGVVASVCLVAVALFAARGGHPLMSGEAMARLQMRSSDSIFGNPMEPIYAGSSSDSDQIFRPAETRGSDDRIFSDGSARGS